jgi:hypothetical protein
MRCVPDDPEDKEITMRQTGHILFLLCGSLAAQSITFQSRIDVAAGNSFFRAPLAAASADFNRDGRPDLAITNTAGRFLTVLLSDQNSGFLPGRNLAAGGELLGIAAADFDGDGFEDTVAGAQSPAALLLFRADGRGGFARPIATPVESTPRSLAAADFDGDGRADLAVVFPESDRLAISAPMPMERCELQRLMQRIAVRGS